MQDNQKKLGIKSKVKKYFSEMRELLSEHIRDYGMFIALATIMLFFAITTGGLFMSARNISNLLNQTGYIAVLSVGVTLVIIIRHIDLSLGFASGFVGAIAGVLIMTYEIPLLFVIPLLLLVGLVIGLWHGFLVAFMKIPAFVATLAGMFIFRGAILQTLSGTGTIVIRNDAFNAISNGYIPNLFGSQGVHMLTLLLGLVGIVFYIYMEFKNHKRKIEYNFDVLSKPMLTTKMVFLSVLIGAVTVLMATYRGFSWTLVILFVVVGVYHIIMNKTTFGRHVYAVGGNPEAAELSGISVTRVTMMVFGSMGFLTAVSGIMFASRLQSATVTAGELFELEAIAGAFVGGASATGGVGKVTGSFIGAVVMAALTSGMNLMGAGTAMQYIVKGAVLVAAVIFDVKTRHKA
jgi:putative multiple sugar transport system permease protein